jgi:hypothetical protein
MKPEISSPGRQVSAPSKAKPINDTKFSVPEKYAVE